jgi:TolB-like protein/tetratricopeptide (TPR) repeat protein
MTTPSQADVRAELEHVATGPAFAQSDRLVSFLRFIVLETLAGRADHIKESVVGVEIFGRQPGYDPKADPIVRVYARQLRQKLRDHYDVQADDRRVRIDLPKGGYVPQFRHPSTELRAGPSTELGAGPRMREVSTEDTATVRSAAIRLAMVATIVTLAVVVASSELYRRARVAVSATSLPRSIAVLPFKNLTGDVAQEYYSDGLSESLITELSTLRDLRVASRGSAFAFKGKDIDPREAGRALRASTIVEGSVRKNGAAVRVDVRLVDAATGGVAWAGEFERAPSDLFILEDEVACRVSAALTGRACTMPAAVDRGTADLEAYRSYLRGRFHIHAQYGAAGPVRALETATGHFADAIERDARFAAAHAGLADAYTQLVWFVPGDVQPLLARAKAAAVRAVELNDRNADAHAALSAVYLHEWQFTAAGEAIGRALLLAPASAWIRHEHSTYLVAMGRTEAGLAEMSKAEELDPLNTAIVADRGNTLVTARRYEEGLAQYRKACQLEVTCAPNTSVGATYLLLGNYTEGIAELQRVVDARGAAEADTTTWLAIGHAMAGRRQRAEQLLMELTRLSRRRHVPPMFLAFAHAALGHHDRAFEALDRAYRDHDIALAQIRSTVWLDPLRRDPRFQDLIRRVGVPD